MRSEKIINNSVARLRPHHAAALLEGAVERLRTRARRGTELTVWIRAVLTHHTAYLMAAPGVLPILATLSQVHMACERQTGKPRLSLVKLWCSEIPQQWGMLCNSQLRAEQMPVVQSHEVQAVSASGSCFCERAMQRP